MHYDIAPRGRDSVGCYRPATAGIPVRISTGAFGRLKRAVEGLNSAYAADVDDFGPQDGDDGSTPKVMSAALYAIGAAKDKAPGRRRVLANMPNETASPLAHASAVLRTEPAPATHDHRA